MELSKLIEIVQAIVEAIKVGAYFQAFMLVVEIIKSLGEAMPQQRFGSPRFAAANPVNYDAMPLDELCDALEKCCTARTTTIPVVGTVAQEVEAESTRAIGDGKFIQALWPILIAILSKLL